MSVGEDRRAMSRHVIENLLGKLAEFKRIAVIACKAGQSA
jgi:hypothetical protein